MALIKNIDTLKQFVKVNFTNQTSQMPDIQGCENRYIIPLIGSEIYADMQALADANNVADPLLKLLRAAIAPLTYYKDLPVIHLQIGDKGINTFVSENVKSAARWEFNSLRDYFAEEGSTALEVLIQYLYDNKADLEWAIPDEYKNVFLTGKEFSAYFPLYQPYRTFEFLRTCCRTAEEEFIRPNLGDDVFEDLRDNYATTEDSRIKNIIKLLKKATAFQTVKLACDLLPVKYGGSGFTVVLSGYGSESANPSDNSATPEQIILLRKQCETNAESYMQQLRTYMNANASSEFFPDYFNSTLYKSPTTEKPKSINESTKSFFL